MTGVSLQLGQHLLLRTFGVVPWERCSKLGVEILVICVINDLEKNVGEKGSTFRYQSPQNGILLPQISF